jgi:hypothetical protein
MIAQAQRLAIRDQEMLGDKVFADVPKSVTQKDIFNSIKQYKRDYEEK